MSYVGNRLKWICQLNMLLDVRASYCKTIFFLWLIRALKEYSGLKVPPPPPALRSHCEYMHTQQSVNHPPEGQGVDTWRVLLLYIQYSGIITMNPLYSFQTPIHKKAQVFFCANLPTISKIRQHIQQTGPL